MNLLPVRRMKERVERAREDSDTSYFYDLLHFAEMLQKLVVAVLVASIEDEKERHRYRLEHRLVRANSVGEWVECLEDVLTGPAGQHLRTTARSMQRQLTQRFSRPVYWQYNLAQLMRSGCRITDSSYEPLGGKANARLWFVDFAWLRNKTRGHGAPTAAVCSQLCPILEESIGLLVENLEALNRPTAFLRRNLSGKFRVVPISDSAEEFEYLKRETNLSLPDGAYIWFDEPLRLSLLKTDVDLSDFYLPNGGMRASHYELLSYITDSRLLVEADAYLQSPTPLPASETRSLGYLEPLGHSFANLPPLSPEYVERTSLEQELLTLLTDDRHPVVTLVGRGGIGKTSLTLKVLHDVTSTNRFLAIVWSSARDIDLLPEGPKLVEPDVLTDRDIAEQFADLMDPSERDEQGFDALEYMSDALTRFSGGPVLFVFDNFETVRNPVDLYRWLDSRIRLPNKVLITTRLRDFKADYPVEVGGMSEEEFQTLVAATATRLGIGNLVTASYRQELYEETDGHPYVVKVMLGEIATRGRRAKVERLIAGREDILEALFERTYAQMSPVAQRVFLTLCNWRSSVPQLALEAALMRPGNERMDVAEGVEVLRRHSLIDEAVADDGQTFLSVPLAAALFGKRKLTVSPSRSAIEADTEFLMLVGASGRQEDLAGIGPRVNRLFRNAARSIDKGQAAMADYVPVLEYVAHGFPPAWLLLAELYVEVKSEKWLASAQAAVRSYLEQQPEDHDAWLRLARLYGDARDYAAEVNAYAQASRQKGVPYSLITDAASRVNLLLADGRLKMDVRERHVVIRDLLSALEARISEADGTDYSRIAWLLMNIGDHKRAREMTKAGLRREPRNPHLSGLKRRLAAEKVR